MSSALNVVTASFGGLREVTTAPLWQWDYGQILKITGLDLPQAFEVHFSNSRKSGETVTQIGTGSQVVIPDMYLTSGADIYCFIFLHDGLTDGETEYVIKIPVRERPEPSDIEPTPVQQDVITEAIAALNDAVEQTGEDKEATAALAEAAAASSLVATEAAQSAQGSATSASASATTASNAAATATTRANEAAQSASEAESARASARNYAASASDSAGDADEAKTAAQSAAQTATTKAAEASISATSASGSASTASASASQASESATQAANSATAASGSATSAATSASTASTKASEASASATAAQTAQTAAEAAQGKAEDAKGEAETTAQSIAASAAQIATNTADITQLKGDLNEIYVESANIYNQATDRHNTTIDSNGVISASNTYKVSDYIYVGAGNKATIQVISGLTLRVFFYTTNDSSGFSRALWFTGTEYQTVQLSNTESYIVIQLRENCPDFMVNMGDTLLPYAPYGGEAGTFLQSVIDEIDDTISAETESLREASAQKDLINRFDPSTISEGKYINVNNGSLSSYDSFFASDFIYIGDLDSVNVSYTHIFGWYDANKNWLGHPDTMNSGNNDLTFDIPENAVYLRFSAYNTNLSLAQIGESVSRSNYASYGKYTLPDLVLSNPQIIVDASGNGDYTSFTRAIYETVDSGVNVLVKPGTYDIVAEYIDLFGQTAVDNMADSDSSIFNGFQYGVRLRNRKVEFAAGTHLVCDWTGHTVDGTHRFSALGVDYNVEIIGLDLVATATFYAIHDDYGLSVPYTVKYENCRVEGINLTNANCIGGGCKKYSRHILKNCYFNNNLTGSATVRYHNTNAEGAEPEIYVSNCYFNNWFTPRWYGPQTSKMRVYVNNCHARAIYKMAESSSYDVDNVELYKWNNEETDPRT